MNEDQHDSPPGNAMDRALMDYLEEILGDTPPERPRVPAKKEEPNRPDNVTPLEIVRPRTAANGELQAAPKPEARQNVTLPFRTAEKPKVLSTLNLLNLKTAPEPVKPKPELVPVKPVSAAPPPAPTSAAAEAPKAKIANPPPVEEKPPEPVPEQAPVPAPALPEVESASALEEKLPQVSEWCDNGRPPWAQERFECLIFNVAGLKLAVPLITLGAIHRIDRKLNALPHQSDWFIGILQTSAAGNIKVLDTALCVMPERYDPAARDQLGYVITIHGYRWGLACRDVEKSITLEPDQVKWRTQRGKRPWLAGTVIDHMCALIDTDGFREVIQKAEQSS